MTKQKEYELVMTLAAMYEQYCGGKYGHNFMGAGEDACEALRQYGLIKADDELDGAAVMRLELQGSVPIQESK